MMMSLKKSTLDSIVEKFKDLKPLLVVGDLGVDKYTFGEVKRISPEAPVPVLEVTKEWDKLGLAANVADNLKSLTVESTLCGLVGNDSRASLVENLLEERGLKTWGIVRDPSRHTTYKERVTTSTQQICRVDYETKEPISDEMTKKILKRIDELKSSHSGLIIEDYGKGLFTQNFCQNLIQEFKNLNLIVTVDPSRVTPPIWYKGATLLKPNRVEAELMVQSLGYFKEKSVQKMAEILIDKLALEKVVITLGAEGMAMFDTKTPEAGLKIIPTAANEVFDVSGAGDTVIAALTSSLLAGASLEEAAWIGNCAAGVVVKKRGTALCTLQELKNHHEHFLSSL